jgi:hypothetical protein
MTDTLLYSDVRISVPYSYIQHLLDACESLSSRGHLPADVGARIAREATVQVVPTAHFVDLMIDVWLAYHEAELIAMQVAELKMVCDDEGETPRTYRLRTLGRELHRGIGRISSLEQCFEDIRTLKAQLASA